MTPTPDLFNCRRPLPTDDFRQSVQATELPTILQVSYWLRDELQQLYYTAGGAAPNAFKLALAHTANHVQCLTTSLHLGDVAAWTGETAVSFPLEHLQRSGAQRVCALAWACFAHMSTALSTIWLISDERQHAITARLRTATGLDAPAALSHHFDSYVDAHAYLPEGMPRTKVSFSVSEFVHIAAPAAPGDMQLLHALHTAAPGTAV